MVEDFGCTLLSFLLVFLVHLFGNAKPNISDIIQIPNHYLLKNIFRKICPGLCRHRPGQSLGKNIKLHEMKNEKNYVCFLITKIWQILKRSLEHLVVRKLLIYEE